MNEEWKIERKNDGRTETWPVVKMNECTFARQMYGTNEQS